jgi:hypothetical protein
MIGKIARALAFRNTPGGTRARAEWAEMQWPHYVADAKAALLALLEPSEAMRDAGGCVTFREYERHYRAMIQAALDEREE